MTTTTAIIAILGIIGALAVGLGIYRITTAPARIAAYGYTTIGVLVVLLSAGLLLYDLADWPVLLVLVVAGAVVVLGLGSLIGYPLLVTFLLWAGITTLRRESLSLANMLSLLAGIGLLLVPTTLALLEPDDIVREDLAYYLQYGVHTALVLLTIYIVTCFAAFLLGSFAYRWHKRTRPSAAVIVLGAGLLDGDVPPLLASRLQRGIQAQRADPGTPVLITSGGQGDDEPVAEGIAMRDYVIDQGIAPHAVIAEDRSTSTQENLVFSRKLLSDPHAPVTVVTSSYHVFRTALLTRELGMRARVIGAPTARYYLPGAMIREFAAVMREHLKIHVIAMIGIIILTVAFTGWIIPAMVIPNGSQ